MACGRQRLPTSVIGGAYHAAIEFDGKEWSYGWTDEGRSGERSCSTHFPDCGADVLRMLPRLLRVEKAWKTATPRKTQRLSARTHSGTTMHTRATSTYIRMMPSTST
jgi:hypothetical protein